MAASVALGAAVALARATGERRIAERRRRSDRLGLTGDERLGSGLRRMALDQLDLALELLQGPFPPDEKAIHETRKAIKRLRALLRMLEDQLSPPVLARENDVLREVARTLSGARDAAVMLATLERLLIDDPGLAASGGVVRLRRRLALEHAQAELETFAKDGARERTIAQLEALRDRVLAWQLAEPEGIELVADGLRRTYRDGRRRYRLMASGRRKGMRARHELRKQVKDLRYAAEMLRRTEPPAHPAPVAKQKQKQKQAEHLHLLARRANEIAEALGEEHDLGLLVALIERERRGSARRSGNRPLGRRRRRALLRLAERRRRLLRKRALRECRRLYEDKPKRFVGRAQASYRACEPLSSR